MSEFTKLKLAINKRFNAMAKHKVFYTDVSKDEIWDAYLSSFPEGTNPMYKERTEYDCNCCKQFIRAIGSAVTVINDEMVSIWDVEVDNFFQEVADTMSTFVKSRPIKTVFLSYEPAVGTNKNVQLLESNKTLTWEHFYQKLPSNLVKPKDSIATIKGSTETNKGVLERSLSEITDESIEIVLELIEQNSLYRGSEHKSTLTALKQLKRGLNVAKHKEFYLWDKAVDFGGASAFRNTVIGTLLVDLSEGTPLEDAVQKFEAKVAPHNYKRPKALITARMVKEAEKKVSELGIEDSLHRRYAVAEDLTINNVLFADRSVQPSMGVFDAIAGDIKKSKPNLNKIEEVTIDSFIKNILPKADGLEVYVENNHTNNFMSLIAPQYADAPSIFKWDNNFSWTYNGEVTDSIKERVKSAGGNVTGHLRCSLSWYNYDDLDISVKEPSGNVIAFNSKVSYETGGKLDVDMNAGGGQSREAVENITWPNKSRMKKGRYKVVVHNFCKRETTNVGFEVEIEYEGVVKNFAYSKPVGDKERVTVAEFDYSPSEGLKFVKSIPESKSSKEVWGVNTEDFVKVTMLMNSPNHWDEQEAGNKHWFFILAGCKNQEKARGFYNEFLKEELTDHRKVFEVLGSKLKAQESDNQLSGVGFSSTKRTSVICRVSGSFNRVVKINF